MGLPRYRPILLLAAAFLFPAAVWAQIRPSQVLPELSTSSDKVLKPGTWVRYTMYLKQTRKTIKVRMAALAKEGKAQWFEISLTDGRRRTIVFKSLVEGTLSAPTRILKSIVQPPGQRALLLPEAVASRQLPRFSKGPGKKATYLATERVKVAAGSFSAKKYRRVHKGVATEAWFSSEVKGGPMIKLVSPRLIMELAAHGDNARSKVRGKAAKMSKSLIKQLGL